MSEWLPWIKQWPDAPSPHSHDEVEWRRMNDDGSWTEPQRIRPRAHRDPLWNVVDVWWRPVVDAEGKAA